MLKDKISELMLEKGINKSELSRGADIPYTTIDGLFKKNSENVKLPTLKKLAVYFGCSIDSLVDDECSGIDNIYQISTQKLPLLGNIACGDPIYADEDKESYVMLGTEVKADFCLKAKGDSMINARINDGDIVFIRKQDIVNNGEIAAVIIDDEATLKRFYYYKKQNMVVLKPENPKHEEKVLTGSELKKVRVLGKAIAFQSDVE